MPFWIQAPNIQKMCIENHQPPQAAYTYTGAAFLNTACRRHFQKIKCTQNVLHLYLRSLDVRSCLLGWVLSLAWPTQTQTLQSSPSHWLVTANEDEWLQFLDPVQASQRLPSLRRSRCLGRLILPPSKMHFLFLLFLYRTLFSPSIFQLIVQENM